MPYNPPPGGSVTLEFDSSAYTPPPGGSVTLDFSESSTATIWVQSIPSVLAFGTAWVDTPRFIYPAGFSGMIVPAPWIDHTPHLVFVVGFHNEVVGDYYYNEFPKRMRVTLGTLGRQLVPPGISSAAAFGTPSVDFKNRTLNVSDTYDLQFGRPTVQGVNAITVSGFDSMAFGDVQKWEEGMLKPQGETHTLFGRPKIQSVISPAGFTGAMGAARVAVPLYGIGGIDGSVIGAAVVASDGEWTCGERARAIPAPGFDSMQFGTPSVS